MFYAILEIESRARPRQAIITLQRAKSKKALYNSPSLAELLLHPLPGLGLLQLNLSCLDGSSDFYFAKQDEIEMDQ